MTTIKICRRILVLVFLLGTLTYLTYDTEPAYALRCCTECDAYMSACFAKCEEGYGPITSDEYYRCRNECEQYVWEHCYPYCLYGCTWGDVTCTHSWVNDSQWVTVGSTEVYQYKEGIRVTCPDYGGTPGGTYWGPWLPPTPTPTP